MKDKTKIRLAIAGIVLTGSMLALSTGFTIAWYNGSSHLSVSNFNINLSDKKLTVSTDNEHFTDQLLYADIKDAIPDKYSPVSSAFSRKWLDQKAETPQFTLGYSDLPEVVDMTSYADSMLATTGFFQKELYIKCDSFAKVTLDSEKTYVNSNKEENKKIAEKLFKFNKKENGTTPYNGMSVEQIEAKLNRIEDSIRLSILVLNDTGKEINDDYQYVIVDPHKNGTTNLGGILDIDGDGYYDSVSGKEVIYGDVLDSSKAIWKEDVRSEDLGNIGTHSCFDAAHKKGVHELDFEKSKDMNIVEEHSLSLEELNQFTFTLQADLSKKIVLSLYIEGWDKDSVDYTMYSHFITSLGFKLVDGGSGGN